MEKLLTPEQVADVLGVKIATIYAWSHYKAIPFIKIGRLLRFRQDLITQWIDSHYMDIQRRPKRCPDHRVKTARSSKIHELVASAKKDVLG